MLIVNLIESDTVIELINKSHLIKFSLNIYISFQIGSSVFEILTFFVPVNISIYISNLYFIQELMSIIDSFTTSILWSKKFQNCIKWFDFHEKKVFLLTETLCVLHPHMQRMWPNEGKDLSLDLSCHIYLQQKCMHASPEYRHRHACWILH